MRFCFYFLPLILCTPWLWLLESMIPYRPQSLSNSHSFHWEFFNPCLYMLLFSYLSSLHHFPPLFPLLLSHTLPFLYTACFVLFNCYHLEQSAWKSRFLPQPQTLWQTLLYFQRTLHSFQNLIYICICSFIRVTVLVYISSMKQGSHH